MLLPLLIVQACFQCYSALSIGSIKETSDIQKYLEKYGFFSKFSSKPLEQELRDGIIRLQTFAGIPKTGKVDEATIKLMNTPRCGLRDPEIKMRKRQPRFLIHGTKWNKNKLTWMLASRGYTLGKDTIRQVLHQAFDMWSSVTNLEFTEISSGEPDIWVRFVRYHHNDPYAFDGPGSLLAHAFFPKNNKGLSGDIHFDDDENFTINSKEGYNLLQIATHNIGHSLGLKHSSTRDAIMYPYYTEYRPGFSLSDDDIMGIQYIYGRKRPAPLATSSTPVTQRS